MFRRTLALALGLSTLLVVGASAAAGTGPTSGTNVLVDQDHGSLFPQNKQNEPAITRDPSTGALIAGANDELNEPLCHAPAAPLTSPCPFGSSVSVNGYYRSADNGKTWTGGFLPNVAGRVGGGDPSLDYGPRRCGDGSFSYSCGTVVYYASLGDPYPEFTGEQILAYRSYDDGATWSTPALAASLDKKSNFADHEWLAVDHTAGSRYFGRAYLFWANYCNTCSGFGNVKLYISHSDDEGRTWTPALQVSSANNNLAQGERETGQMAVASDGTVEAFWTENADSKGKYPDTQVVVTSKDGGSTFTAPITVGYTTDYPLSGTPFDAVDLYNRVPGMSARADCYPHPASDPSSTRVYVVWCDYTGGHGVVRAAVSSDGLNWTSLGTVADISGRNAFFPAASVSPSGLVAVATDALTAPPASDLWQTGAQVYDNYYVQSTDHGASFTAPLRVSTASSNPEGSGYNNVQEQFLGDYIGIVAGPTSAYIAFTDSRNASLCGPVQAYQSSVYAGSKTAIAPNPDTDCAKSFGNTDTVVGIVGY
jgi:hypothetical protein